ncbi:hypothetical protein HAX54_002981, partial [Datura stramonium]|nr:hypothetical protein [Datura stramonium]
SAHGGTPAPARQFLFLTFSVPDFPCSVRTSSTSRRRLPQPSPIARPSRQSPLRPRPSAPHCLDMTTPTVPPHSPLPAGGGNHHWFTNHYHSATQVLNSLKRGIVLTSHHYRQAAAVTT